MDFQALGDDLAASALDTDERPGRQADLEEARQLWDDVSHDVRDQIRKIGADLEDHLAQRSS